MANLKDIAQKLGVSVSTVSRGLNGGKEISREMTEKILKAADELGYTLQGRGGRATPDWNSAGIIVPEVASEYYARLVHKAKDFLAAKGYSLIMKVTDFKAAELLDAINTMSRIHVKCLLGPWYGLFAAGIGSGLADLLAGYAHYVPGTFLIKGLVALIAALLLRPLLKKGEKIPFWRLAVIELPSEVVMVLGYFGYKALILGKGLSAAASIPNNLVQAAIGIVLSVLLYTALSKVPEIHKSFWKGE